MHWSASLPPQMGIQLIESGLSPCATSRRNITENPFGFHDPDVRFLRNGHQVIGGVSFDQAARTPVIGDAYLVHHLPVDKQRPHAPSHQCSSLNDPACSHKGDPAPVFDSAFCRQLGGYFTEEFGLKLS